MLAAVATDLDLDVLAPPERSFTMGGREYRLPGDLPARTVVRFVEMGARMETMGDDVQANAEVLDEMISLVAGLVARYNPGVEKAELEDMLTMPAVQQIMALAIGGTVGQEFPDAVVDTLTAGRQPEASEVDRADPTLQTPPETQAAA